VQGIEVGRARSEIKTKDASFPAGSYVVKRDQPYGRLAKILLEKQNFPDPALRTYDDTGWTMGLMLHTDVKEIADKAILDAAVDPVSEAKAAGSLTGSGRVYAIAHHGSNSMATLRYRLKGLRVLAAESAFKAGDVDYPAGSFLIATDQPGADRVKATVEALGLTGAALDAMPSAPTHELDLPRVAMYSTWGGTQEVGWVRHAFDAFEIPFELIYKEQVQKGGLRGRYDVIVIPNQGRTAKGLVFDIAPRKNPIDYKKSAQFQNLGGYGESDDISGGMGLQGAAELQKFVEDGGLLITLAAASFFPPEFGIARRVEAARPSGQFYAPGPIVQAEILQPSHPIFYGYTQKTLPGALGQRAAAERPGAGPRGAGVDALPGRRGLGAVGPDARSERDPRSAGDRRRAHGQGTRAAVLGQPVLPLAEPRRVQHAVRRGAALERREAAAGVRAGREQQRRAELDERLERRTLRADHRDHRSRRDPEAGVRLRERVRAAGQRRPDPDRQPLPAAGGRDRLRAGRPAGPRSRRRRRRCRPAATRRSCRRWRCSACSRC
jgi:hypothetical protein